MKLDSWTYFNLPKEARQMIDAFASPDHESSIAKDIPIGALEQARNMLQPIAKLSGRRLHIRYRGPRHDWSRSVCLRQDAMRFAVYFR